MITRIEAREFRSLKDVDQDLSPFQVLVGPNGSGKSNFLDVLAFLGDLLRSGPAKAILGDAAARIPPRAIDPTHLGWMREANQFELAVDLAVPEPLVEAVEGGPFKGVRYEVAVTIGRAEAEVDLAAETLWLTTVTEKKPQGAQQRALFPEMREARPSLIHESGTPKGWRKVVSMARKSGTHNIRAETSSWTFPLKLGGRTGLANLPEDETKFPIATWTKHKLMEGVQRVVFNAEAMRRPSAAGAQRRFLPDGSNLPWVIHDLSTKAPDRFRRWVAHVRTAIPELKSIRTQVRPEDRSRYLVVEYSNGLKAPSWVVSDGTLRLLALTLIAYMRDADGVYLVEEPENGIHPKAVETVYEALSSVGEGQVLEVKLRTAWGERARCVVIDPEVDVWLWTDSPHLCSALGLSCTPEELRAWLADQGLWPSSSLKPSDPKEAFKRAAARGRVPAHPRFSERWQGRSPILAAQTRASSVC